MRLLKLVPENTNIHFLKWRLPFFIISGLLVIASWVLVLTQGLNLGVDFVGGQMIRITFTQSKEAPVAALRGEVEKLGYGEPAIQTFGAPNAVSIRMRLPAGSEHNTGLADAMAKRITAAVKAAATGYPAPSHAPRVITATASTIGTKTPEMRSARRWTWALPVWAFSTSRAICASWVSEPTRAARTTSRPPALTVAPTTVWMFSARRPTRMSSSDRKSVV